MPARNSRRAGAVLLSVGLVAGVAFAALGRVTLRARDPRPGSAPGPGAASRLRAADPVPAHPWLPIAGTTGEVLRPDIDVYRGLGTWIDLYDRAWSHPGAVVRRMRARGIRTLYLETSNFSRGAPFVFSGKVGRFIDAAHRYGVAIVAWYLPGFRDLQLDLRRSLAAIRLHTRRGHSFDSFALDIESEEIRHPRVRTARLVRLSSRLRALAGTEYPLGAIIPSPRRLLADPTYWPGFPYRRLADVYDVFLPMTYFTYRVSGREAARWYTAGNIQIIRRETGDRSVAIHVIGGIGGDATTGETVGFVSAVRRHAVIGASYYTFPRTSTRNWSVLARVRPSSGSRPGR